MTAGGFVAGWALEHDWGVDIPFDRVATASSTSCGPCVIGAALAGGSSAR